MIILFTLLLNLQLIGAQSGSCSKVFKKPLVDNKFCPARPKRNTKGGKCYPAHRVDMNRHAKGYKNYLEKSINEAVEFVEEKTQTEVDRTLVMSILAKESWFNPVIKNKWGDRGIAQFQKATAQATLDYMDELGIDFEKTVTDELPPSCKTGSYSDRLSAKCFASIRKNCSKKKYSASLYCPKFALKLMVFHFQQIQARDVMIEHDGKQYNARELMVRDGDSESEIRHLASVYNRGFRIYNSAYHDFLAKKKWPTAKQYGKLWGVPREVERSKDPFVGGTLSGHYINRCYVWAISGLCGGMKGALIEKYSKQICAKKPKFGQISLFEGDLSVSQAILPLEVVQRVETLERLSYSGLSELVERFRDHGVENRNSELKIIKAIAKRRWLANRSIANSRWLYLSARAGYLRFSGGHSELQEYIKVCKNKECDYVASARRMNLSLRAMSPEKKH